MLDERDVLVFGVPGTLASSWLSRESLVLNVEEPLSTPIAVLSRWGPLSMRRRTLKNPSSGVGSADDLLELIWDDLSIEGERLFHAATMLRTELNGERGDACGRLSEGPWGVVSVSVAVYEVAVNVFEYVGVELDV